MKVPKDRVVSLGGEALKRIADASLPDQKRYLLAECLQAYLPIEDQQQPIWERMLLGEQFVKVKVMNQTVYEKGRAEGVRLGRIATLKDLLQEKFGVLSPELLQRLEQLPDDRLRHLTTAINSAPSLKELDL